jgi:hypothetical protein
MMLRRRRSSLRAMLLMEAMVAVAIFVLAILGIGKAIEQVMVAQVMKDETEKVQRFLDSKMSEVQAGAVPLQDSTVEEIKDWLPGAKLKTTRKPLKRLNEKEQELFGLFHVTLELTWLSDGQPATRSLSFYIFPRQR